MTTTETFYAENIRCSGCINTIQAALYKIPGVQAVQVSLTEKKISILGIAVRRDLITKALNKMGYPESGHNSMFRKAISLLSCSAGK